MNFVPLGNCNKVRQVGQFTTTRVGGAATAPGATAGGWLLALAA